MNPDQFEHAVADFFQQQGYAVERTPQSYDYGVDVIASKEEKRVAVQVKMYKQRQVNYRDVMYLFAGQVYYDCNRAALITSGEISANARRVAEKLGVEVSDNWRPSAKVNVEQSLLKSEALADDTGSRSHEKFFSEVWEQYIMPLKGKKVCTSTGKENLIHDVNWDCLRRESSRGGYSKIDFKIFRLCHSYVMENGRMTRDEINHLCPERASAIIFAVLNHIPYFSIERNQKATLVLDNDKLQQHRLAQMH